MLDETAALAAVRADFPWWAGLAPLAFVPFAMLLAIAGTHVAVSVALISHRGIAADAHWTERARRAWPARTTAAGAPLVCGILLGMTGGALLGPLSLVPGSLLALLTGVAVYFAASTQIGRVERIVRGRATTSTRERMAGQVFSFLALVPHVMIVLVGAVLMPADPLPALAAAALVFALLIAVAMGAGLRACIALGLVRPAGERLRAIVAECGDKVGVRAKRVWVVRWPVVNALAFPRTGELAFTEKAVTELGDEHLMNITAHELGHLGEPRSVVLARSVGLFTLFPITLIRPLVGADAGDPLRGGSAALALLLLGFALGLVVKQVARRMEERADAVAHAHEDDPGAYARALERIYELNLVPAVTGAKRPIHPHLYDRLVSSGVTPGYPRPRPPSRAASMIATLALLAFVSSGIFAWSLAPVMMADERGPSVLATTLRGVPRDDLEQLGVARWNAGDLEGALRYYRALSAIDRESAYFPADVASLAASTGRCDEARAALLEATTRATGDPYFGNEVLPETTASVEGCMPRPE